MKLITCDDELYAGMMITVPAGDKDKPASTPAVLRVTVAGRQRLRSTHSAHPDNSLRAAPN